MNVSQHRSLYTLISLITLYYLNELIPLVAHKAILYWTSLCFIFVVAIYRNSLRDLAKSSDVVPFLLPLGVVFFLGALPLEWMEPGKRSLQIPIFTVVMLLGALFAVRELPLSLWERTFPIFCLAILAATLFHSYGHLTQDYSTLRHRSGSVFYTNPHYAAHFCLMSIAVLGYAVSQQSSSALRMLFSVGILACGWILIETQSRPAWIALITSLGFGILLFMKRRERIFGLAALITLSASLYLFLPDSVSNRIDDLLNNIGSEERVQLWSDGLRMQMASEPFAWLVGHGPGSYASYFKPPFNEVYAGKLFFPHNFVLELLFESGVIGLAVMGFFYFHLYRLMARLAKRKLYRAETILVFGGISANLILTFITIPFYSKYVLLMQIPFIVLLLHLLGREHAKQASD